MTTFFNWSLTCHQFFFFFNHKFFISSPHFDLSLGLLSYFFPNITCLCLDTYEWLIYEWHLCWYLFIFYDLKIVSFHAVPLSFHSFPPEEVILLHHFFLFLKNSGRIYKHSQQPLITYEKHDVTDHPKNVGGSRSLLLLKAHGKLHVK